LFDWRPPPPKPPPTSTDGNGDDEHFWTRQQQMFNRFKKFHAENPRVWKLFERFALELINTRKFEHYSSDAIVQRIRWHVALETREDAPYDEIKIGDHYRAYYARMFHVAHPEHAGFFRNKFLRSKNYPPYKHEPSPDGRPAGPEPD